MATKKAKVSGKPRTRRKSVELRCYAPDAAVVGVAGTFNQWNSEKSPMRKGDNDEWTVRLQVSEGRHEYRFVADGAWFSDDQADEVAENPHGSHNSVLIV